MIEAQLEFPIRPYDVDMAGIVSNIVYVRWLEDLRMELLGNYFPPRDLLARNLMPVVVRTEINYRASLRFLDSCLGHMSVIELGRTSATMQATFKNADGMVVADARQVGVFIDSSTGKPVLMPDQLRTFFEGPAKG
ncbi:MAG TPA: acyl-CoA thioesterase [Pyrinomonadaceae bacterium]